MCSYWYITHYIQIFTTCCIYTTYNYVGNMYQPAQTVTAQAGFCRLLSDCRVHRVTWASVTYSLHGSTLPLSLFSKPRSSSFPHLQIAVYLYIKHFIISWIPHSSLFTFLVKLPSLSHYCWPYFLFSILKKEDFKGQ
jgi:hypothetical protein